MENSQIISKILTYLSPSDLSYEEWLHVGMALKNEGHTCSAWENWSRSDVRHVPNECERKWNGFGNNLSKLTVSSLLEIAKNHGVMVFENNKSKALDWTSTISDEHKIIDTNWLQGTEIYEPKNWNPIDDLIKYLTTLFNSDDYVGYVTRSYEKPNSPGKYLPTKGTYGETCGDILNNINKYKDDIGAIFGDYNKDVGAWIRFNPLDGQGVLDKNVTDFRYTLVESDSMTIEKQYTAIKELELPVACLVHSGGKSLHAIVKVDAANYQEYRERVDFLHQVCNKNGLEIDKQNKNPSRLSRMPGILRNDHKQYLVDTNIGHKSWLEWREWIESVNDNLPDIVSLKDKFNNPPELSPVLIDGILRQRHKMIISGPSKAGKSFSLIELAIAIAEGKKWFNEWKCAQGKVLYVNLELDDASCFHRYIDVYNALNLEPENIDNIHIWNLRGKSVPMDKLAPKLIRRAQKDNYIAIIIDPIYKIITGDENSADQMAHFFNQFDKICTELNTAVIICHHFSKGAQGGKKSQDRASGSGVFARDPDAILSLTELELTKSIKKQQLNKRLCDMCIYFLNTYNVSALDQIEQDILVVSNHLIKATKEHLNSQLHSTIDDYINKITLSNEHISAWRIESSLREFARYKDVNCFFKYPIHVCDNIGVLKDLQAEGYQNNKNYGPKKSKEQKKLDKELALDNAFNFCAENGETTVKELAEHMGKSQRTVREIVKDFDKFQNIKGKIKRKEF